jgi:hypothetical protein
MRAMRKDLVLVLEDREGGNGQRGGQGEVVVSCSKMKNCPEEAYFRQYNAMEPRK